jgi:hypothetical protein
MTTSCDFQGNASLGYCQEYTATPDILKPYEDACKSSAGTYAASACSHTGSVGGCKSTTASPAITITNWFYSKSGMTNDTVMSSCSASGNGATYVAP